MRLLGQFQTFLFIHFFLRKDLTRSKSTKKHKKHKKHKNHEDATKEKHKKHKKHKANKRFFSP